MLQRKPVNRLGLRGAQEVREHSWLKFYPWKDLYDKKIPSPFMPKLGDNFDAKYCNALEILGNATKEKYEQYLREDYCKEVFKDFYFNSNELDSTDKNKTINKKFYNPHLNIQTDIKQSSNTEGDKESKTFLNLDHFQNYQTEQQPKILIDKINNLNNIDSKFSKIKMMSSCGSTNSLIRNYRQSNGNLMSVHSTNASSGTQMHKKSGSCANLNY